MKQWYEELFENYALGYDREKFTLGTIPEVDFIEQELGFDRSLRVLDVGCGTGRHAVELARRGYTVTGVDLSRSLLERARQKAIRAGVSVIFRQQDARELDYTEEFAVALLICEGAFPLMETDEMNFHILRGVRRALHSPGKMILTTLNALYPLSHSAEELLNADAPEARIAESTFDLLTFRMTSIFEVTDDSGLKKSLHCNERYYAPSEISWLLASLGFQKIEIYGCAPGQFTKNKVLTPNDYEMLVIATC
ncbi:MAG TPA: class I SAM-dependent methyltransferase [Candidatus Binatia bacterium]|jgi:2-polyprenyl-3-methyl-5-hydroxy-6-metoxy-1,4-benzoquinol methylase|nr:class I SAM-dependent methyltransferase [Candidatus Binatia bacterium]